MFKSIEEVKSFIIWAKEQKLKSVKIGDISIDISEIGYIEEGAEVVQEGNVRSEFLQNDKTTTEEEELLYWSSGR